MEVIGSIFDEGVSLSEFIYAVERFENGNSERLETIMFSGQRFLACAKDITKHLCSNRISDEQVLKVFDDYNFAIKLFFDVQDNYIVWCAQENNISRLNTLYSLVGYNEYSSEDIYQIFLNVLSIAYDNTEYLDYIIGHMGIRPVSIPVDVIIQKYNVDVLRYLMSKDININISLNQEELIRFLYTTRI